MLDKSRKNCCKKLRFDPIVIAMTTAAFEQATACFQQSS